MRRLLVALLVIPVLWTPVAVTRAFAQAGEKVGADKALIDNERKISQAVAKGDRASFLALAAEDGVWASGGGFVPVTLFGGSLDQIKVTRWEIVNPQVLWVNPTTALVIYVWTGSGSFMDQPFAPKIMASTVWTKRGDKWVAVYHQESDAPRQ